MLEIILLGSLAVLAYIYVGYPVLAMILGRVFERPVSKAAELPSVTVVITAYNEERHIADKIDNVLALDYPGRSLEIIVASDASDDATDEIVSNFGAPNIRLLRVEGRQGKTACQNAAASASSAELLVFTDATTMLEQQSLRVMAANFHDPQVGCVAGRLVYLVLGDDATGKGGTSYWGYETRLRLAESALGSLVGVSGCLYAVRRSAYRPIAPDLISDFVIAMDMRDQHLRTVLEPTAICSETTLDRPDRELSMRIRVGLRSLSALASRRRFLNPFRYGVFAWQLWSHKLLRYLSPVFVLLAAGSNFALALKGQYQLLMALQIATGAAGLTGFIPGWRFRQSPLTAQPYYFLLTNVASAISIVRFLRGERVLTWRPLR
ncbi:MAG: glycosyltransferase family 2 protein [Pseudomonadota bacterium]|nr:glycosyltransferase family 2 protein [Pseudomonadota bacterium]